VKSRVNNLKPYTDNELQVRNYRKGDEFGIARLFNICFGQSGGYFPYTPELWKWRYLLRPDFDPESIFIVEDSGRIISSIVMTYATMSVNGSPKLVALVGDVSTHLSYRRQGHATNLMKRAIERAEKRGCWAIHLTANPYGKAIRIYNSLGFRTFVRPIYMVSPLRKENGTSEAGLVLSIPIFFMDSILSMRSIRHVRGNIKLRVVCDAAAQVSLLGRNEIQGPRNGGLMMGEEYWKWFSSPRPEGAIGVFEVANSRQRAGVVTMSSIRTMVWGKTMHMASISNPLIAEDKRDSLTLGEVLLNLREFAANQLDCAAASILVDPRDTVTLEACRRARFFRGGSLASMIHPLGDIEKIREIREGYWNQPLEAAKPVP
jgi:GNAT superfamily N-acetyltransferase